MSAPVTDQPTTTPARTGAPPAGAGNRAPRRHGSASRHVGAAGQTRRNLQRDLARREASLRITRRVSGPAGGATRPPLADAPVATPVAPAVPFAAPTAPSAPAPVPAAAPAARLAPAPSVGADLRPAPAGLEVPAFVGSTKPRRAPRPAATRPAPARPVQPRPSPVAAAPAVAQPRIMPIAAPTPVVRTRPLASAAAALAAAPARLPLSLPQRARVAAISGTVVEAAPAGRRRVSTPAIMVAAVTMVILTFGAILGLQIRKTQVNAQMGADLSAISALQQKVTATRESLNRASASANVDGAARKGGLIEPDLTDVDFTKVGSRTESAERAKRLLSKAPVAPTAAGRAAAEAKAKAEAAAAASTAPSTGVQTPSATGTSMATVPDTSTQTSQPATDPAATGAGAIQ